MTLERPIVFFDLETTGVKVHRDEIVQFAMIKIGDGWEEQSTLSMMVKPTIPIPEEALNVHGITDQMLVEQPEFKDIAWSIYHYIDGCDLAGYNSKWFDNPILARQMGECLGMEYRENILNRNTIDVYLMNTRLNKRMKLGIAYHHYFGIELEGAHDALTDVRATIQICRAMCARYGVEETNGSLIAETAKKGSHQVDEKSMLIYVNRQPVFNFGKHRNKTVQDVYEEAPSYLDWVLLSDFDKSVKDEINKVILANA